MIDRDARRFERAREAFRETFTPAQVAKIEKAEKLGWTVTQKHIKTGEVFLANDKNNATMVIEQDGSVSR
jgi:hypothetical protein